MNTHLTRLEIEQAAESAVTYAHLAACGVCQRRVAREKTRNRLARLARPRAVLPLGAHLRGGGDADNPHR